jgi:hypothetical protein
MVTRSELLNLMGSFTWFWCELFFIETKKGNFVWSDPDYNGDNTIKLFSGSIFDFHKQSGYDYGRCKGEHQIYRKCGDQIIFVETDEYKP